MVTTEALKPIGSCSSSLWLSILVPTCGLHERSALSRFMLLPFAVRKVVLKTGLKLNPKKLYGADGYAVKASTKGTLQP